MSGAAAQRAEDASSSTPIDRVLRSLANELEHARDTGLRIEGAICAIAVRGSLDASVVSELQQLDAILQHLAALRDFARTLADSAEPGQLIETDSAYDQIPLADCHARMTGQGAYDESGVWEML